MSFDPNKITLFAKTDARGQNIPFGIKAQDRSRHMYVIGKTGMGKSTLLENMAVQDIKNGEGMAFIDPHGQTAETLLDYIPEERKDDVLYFAPFDTNYPVAFNVMEDVGPDKRHLVVSGLMSVFKKIWLDAWSARMEYILQNTLLALLEYPDSTLLGVNRMLSDKNYRRKVIDNISDPAVKSFWVDEFLNYNERYMQEAGDAIKNKIGQFTANPLIRNIIGQPKSSFDIRKMMDEKKIIIMNLSKGLVGESNANLLGSMLTTRIYLAAMSRADLSQANMREAPQFYFYVDEFQSFANATFADILSEARKYKLNLTIAHQYIEQMEEEVRNAVFGNVGTIVSFRVGPFDAEVLETIFAPQFFAVDICNLGFAQIYLTLMIDGIGSAPFSAVTLPPIEQHGLSCKEMVIHSSRRQFAKGRAEVEEAIVTWVESGTPAEQNKPNTQGGSGSGGGNNSGNNNSQSNKSKSNTSNNQRSNNQNRPPQQNRPRDEQSVNKASVPSPVNVNGDANKKFEPKNSAPAKDNERSDFNKNQKSVEDLRAVLARLVKTNSGTDTDQKIPIPVEKKEIYNQAVSDPQPRRGHSERINQVDKTDFKSTDQKKEAPKDVGMELKEALASVIGAKGIKSEIKTEANDKTDITKTEENKVSKVTVEKSDAKPEPEPTGLKKSNVDDKQDQKTTDQSLRKVETDQTVSNKNLNAGQDPFDPKVLERMMRVRTGDKTPFK
jgi:hypothetical protein